MWGAAVPELARLGRGVGRSYGGEIATDGRWWLPPMTRPPWVRGSSARSSGMPHGTGSRRRSVRQVTDVMATAMPTSRTFIVEGGHLIDPADPAVLSFLEELPR
jgi:hypothetical protein